jgi:hypothetical protein
MPRFTGIPYSQTWSEEKIREKIRIFWSKCTKTEGGCWLWRLSQDKDGYGRTCFLGKVDKAHRVAWMLYHGPVPEELCVLHKCDVPACINPDHLFLGTELDNAQDRDTKGRTGDTAGEKNGAVKLTWPVVRQIRKELAEGLEQVPIAEKYGVSKSLISQIHTNKIWRECHGTA